MENIEKPRNGHWLLLIVLLGILIVSVVLIYMTQGGQYFQGASLNIETKEAQNIQSEIKIPNNVVIPAVKAFCGNGIVEIGEQCDDGNITENDACNNLCQVIFRIDDPIIAPLIDLCENMNGLQIEIPSGFERIDRNCFPLPDPDDNIYECGNWSDVDDNDEEYDIWLYLCNKGIFKGDEGGTLRPDELLTRGELLALAFRASDYENEYEVDEDSAYCFEDVNDEWFAKYACTALDLGFVEGYSGNEFRPGRNVILAEGLKMFLGALDEPFTINPDPNRWYYNMVEDAADDSFLPYNLTDVEIVGPIELTRRKAANMIYRVMKFR